MIKKTIKIPIYFGELTIIQTDDFAKIEKQYSLKETNSYEAFTFKNLKSNYLQITVVFNNQVSPRTVAHESLHILNWIFTERNIEYDFYNDEPAAYLLGWIVEQVHKTIKVK